MTHIKISLKHFLFAAFAALSLMVGTIAWAQSGARPVIIRDTEIEDTFRGWITPLLKVAGLNVESVNLVLVQSDQVNAFVAGGANIFIYTGLIDKTTGPEEIIGVLAHELGHIAGGHLIDTRDAMRKASYESILGMVLGVGTAIATGQGAAASAIMSGSSSIAQRNFMAHSRVNESSADQAALRFMEAAHINPSGLGSFLEKLESEELLPLDQQSAYMRTHPLTRERIADVETKAAASTYKDTDLRAEWKEQHARMKAKLSGYINPGRVPWVYDDRDQSVAARYARAVAAYRQNETGAAIKGIDALIATEPDNPYFHELRGQMLKDFGRVAEALPSYRKAVTLKPGAGLIRADLGHVLLESAGDNKQTLQEAIDQLHRALQEEPRTSRIHRLLATAYGRLGQETQAKLHLAEEALLQGRFPYAKSQASAVQKTSSQGSREWIQAQDILSQAETLENLQN
jgi:predicted Zn-dependent protease